MWKQDNNGTARFKKYKQLFEYQDLLLLRDISGLYYEHVTIINDDSNIVSKWSF
jgi:hypothetical protein